MRNNTVGLLAWPLLLAAFATGCAGNAEAGSDGEEDQARLEIRGSSGTEFSGSCAIGDEEPEEIGGQVPDSLTYDLGGRPLECEIRSEGDVEVELTAGSDRSVLRTSGGTLNLAYDNGSISSTTTSSTSSSSSTSSRTASSSGSTGEETGGTTDEAGNVASESRDVAGFDEVELNGVGNLSIRQTGSESLTVEAEEDVLSKIRTEVVDGRLIIGPEPGTTIRTTEPINYTLTVEDLRVLALSGAGNIDAEDISTGELAVTISGTGDVSASGEADSQQIDISGSGEYRAGDLESGEVRIKVEGTGSAVVNASDSLNAQVSGIGSVEYIGDPVVDQDVSGVGEVSRH